MLSKRLASLAPKIISQHSKGLFSTDTLHITSDNRLSHATCLFITTFLTKILQAFVRPIQGTCKVPNFSTLSIRVLLPLYKLQPPKLQLFIFIRV